MGKEGEECLREKSIMNGFDENIVIEILVRLPMKNQFQCKLVCKRWFGLISSPLFSQRVLATKVSSSMPWFLIYRYEQPYFMFGPPKDFDSDWEMYDFHTASDHNSDEPIIPQLTINLRSEYTGYTVYAAHNGLILCHTYRNYSRGKGLLVCNPLTGKWVSIPDSRISRFGVVGFIVSLNNGRTQFKVVIATYQYHHHNPGLKYEYFNFEVFSSEVGEWMDTGVSFPLQGEHYNDPKGVVYDGKLVWRFGERADRLLGFDPDKKECRIFSLNVPFSVPFETIIGTCRGRLCYANYAYEEEKMSVRVCVLENYEKEEWRELAMTQISSNVDMNEIDDDFGIAPLAFHPFDMDIVYFQIRKSNHTRIFSFNIQTNQFISFIGEQIPKYLYVRFPISVFVLPPFPTSVPELTYNYANQDYHSYLRHLFCRNYDNHMDDFGSDLNSLFSL